MPSRIEQEHKTVEVMIELYRRKHHAAGNLCAECSELLNYANDRLDKYP